MPGYVGLEPWLGGFVLSRLGCTVTCVSAGCWSRSSMVMEGTRDPCIWLRLKPVCDGLDNDYNYVINFSIISIYIKLNTAFEMRSEQNAN